MTSLLRTLARWWQRDRKEGELQEELQFHLDEEAADRARRG